MINGNVYIDAASTPNVFEQLHEKQGAVAVGNHSDSASCLKLALVRGRSSGNLVGCISENRIVFDCLGKLLFNEFNLNLNP